MYPLTSVDSVKYLRSNSVGKCLTLHHYKYSHNIGQIQWECVSLYTTTDIPTILVKFSIIAQIFDNDLFDLPTELLTKLQKK